MDNLYILIGSWAEWRASREFNSSSIGLASTFKQQWRIHWGMLVKSN